VVVYIRCAKEVVIHFSMRKCLCAVSSYGSCCRYIGNLGQIAIETREREDSQAVCRTCDSTVQGRMLGMGTKQFL
jgi:hypothetical protein